MEPLNLTEADWVLVSAKTYVFEPWGIEFAPVDDGGHFVITVGPRATRHRGVEVLVAEDGATVWVPVGGRVFWCPAAPSDSPDEPWETRLREWDHEQGRYL